ncbi:hypothetical protein HDU91_005019, partial [Kappamyces sp. JEL0680]
MTCQVDRVIIMINIIAPLVALVLSLLSATAVILNYFRSGQHRKPNSVLMFVSQFVNIITKLFLLVLFIIKDIFGIYYPPRWVFIGLVDVLFLALINAKTLNLFSIYSPYINSTAIAVYTVVVSVLFVLLMTAGFYDTFLPYGAIDPLNGLWVSISIVFTIIVIM